MKQGNSKFLIILAALSFIIPLTVIYSYNYSDKTFFIFGLQLKKLSPENTEIITKKNSAKIKIINPVKKKQPNKVVINQENDSILNRVQIPLGEEIVNTTPYTRENIDYSKQRILIMGDSECGGLYKELNDYCVFNGHDFVATIAWTSATILNFAYSDTIVSIINQYQPTYIFIVVGLNELQTGSIEKRRDAANLLASKIKGIPYSWIGPANYINDNGINKAFLSASESGAFFLSRDLNLPKGNDKRHPSTIGYRIWMDTIAHWIRTEAKYPLVMNTPTKRNLPRKTKVIYLNASKYRGY